MAGEESTRKWGEGHAEAMFRLGLRELRAAMYTDSNIAQEPEYGLYGTMTPGEIAEARRGDPSGQDRDGDRDTPSILDDRLNQAAARDRDDRSDGRDWER